MNLNNLPVEIIDNICSQLRDQHSDRHRVNYQPAAREGLVNLCRTSKGLFNVVTPYLYHHVRINNQNFLSFTRSLFRNHTLADLVHRLDVDGPCIDPPSDPRLEECYYPLPPPSKCHTQPYYDLWRAARTLENLLVRVRNLEALDITIHGDFFRIAYFWQIKWRHLAKAQFAPRLKEVTLRRPGPVDGFCLDSIISLLATARIQKLSLFACRAIANHKQQSLPALKELSIYNSGLSESDFTKLVKLCPNIESLYYEVDDESVTEQCGTIASSEQTSRALYPLKDTLRTLILYQPRLDDCDNKVISSLTELHKLENLTISMDALAGATEVTVNSDSENEHLHELELTTNVVEKWLDKLPRSLRSLCIIKPVDSLFPELLGLAIRGKKDFPNLRCVIVDEPIGLNYLFQDTEIEYKELSHSEMQNHLLGFDIMERIVDDRQPVKQEDEQTDSGDERIRCAQCPMSFDRTRELREHDKHHRGARIYGCICGKAFARCDALERHRQRGTCIGAFGC